MQNMPRPRGADAAGLLLRELDLHPPAEEWHRQNSYVGPWTDLDDEDDASDAPTLLNPLDSNSLENSDIYHEASGLWPRKRRMSERDAAFGLNTSESLGAYLGIMGSRRDVVTAVWKNGLEGVWYKYGVTCLTWLGASYVATGSMDGAVRLWDSRSGECVKVFRGHSEGIQTLSLSANREYLVTASLDHTARVFEVKDFC
ncbi:mediator of RNA polymerase II transcription subunit 16 [Lathyrus oleraceus]|nr:mediator of RNA polymerase II transcription subunit 16-like [Pisum sativum]KAI5433095.1 variant 4, Mediator of RNA polymerase II transcription subunit 16 [Pisum sativum]